MDCEDANLNNKYRFYNETFEVDGKVGLKDIAGNILVPAIYKEIGPLFHYDLKDCLVGASNEEGKYALINPDGKGTPITPFVYDFVDSTPFMAFYPVIQNGKLGFVNGKGEMITPCELDHYQEPFNDIVTIDANGKYGVLTLWGLYVKPIFDEIEDDDNEMVHVRLGDKWGFIDDNGEFIEEHEQDRLDESYLLNFNP